MVNVIVKGFKNRASAQAWIAWYIGSGEQDSDMWLENNSDNNPEIQSSAYVGDGENEIQMEIQNG